MQELDSLIIKEASKELRQPLKGIKGKYPIGVNFLCPLCQYSSKKNRFSARIYPENMTFICFSCGEKRRLE